MWNRARAGRDRCRPVDRLATDYLVERSDGGPELDPELTRGPIEDTTVRSSSQEFPAAGYRAGVSLAWVLDSRQFVRALALSLPGIGRSFAVAGLPY